MKLDRFIQNAVSEMLEAHCVQNEITTEVAEIVMIEAAMSRIGTLALASHLEHDIFEQPGAFSNEIIMVFENCFRGTGIESDQMVRSAEKAIITLFFLVINSTGDSVFYCPN